MNPSSSDIGIIDFEIYYPLLCVDQKELEVYDGCQGKYISGLGQKMLAICPLVEDPVSIALTVVHRLMERTGLDYSKIGRVDVGTESSIDHSKSIKSHLMELFVKSNNFSVEGADNINACYGGTAALFNCLNWVACQPNNGKLALVVTSDISTYSNESKGARATSGAASVCMVIGRNAILPFETTKGHYMCNSYDFYKPICLLYPEFDELEKICSYMKAKLSDLKDRLVRPPTYLAGLIVQRFNREAINLSIKHSELGNLILPNTYYLKSIDNKNRRFYDLYTTP
ncbi:hypothetical protein MXB_1316 [Myxobolus squamalis]|nr:hypothetical protein MXB_1316 [Myxobolus squamalis]